MRLLSNVIASTPSHFIAFRENLIPHKMAKSCIERIVDYGIGIGKLKYDHLMMMTIALRDGY